MAQSCAWYMLKSSTLRSRDAKIEALSTRVSSHFGGFRVQGLGFRVQGWGFRVFGVSGLGTRNSKPSRRSSLPRCASGL